MTSLTKSNYTIKSVSSGNPGTFLEVLLKALSTWQRRREERESLAAMPDHQLNDIGVTRGEALREARKPFWRG